MYQPGMMQPRGVPQRMMMPPRAPPQPQQQQQQQGDRRLQLPQLQCRTRSPQQVGFSAPPPVPQGMGWGPNTGARPCYPQQGMQGTPQGHYGNGALPPMHAPSAPPYAAYQQNNMNTNMNNMGNNNTVNRAPTQLSQARQNVVSPQPQPFFCPATPGPKMIRNGCARTRSRESVHSLLGFDPIRGIRRVPSPDWPSLSPVPMKLGRAAQEARQNCAAPQKRELSHTRSISVFHWFDNNDDDDDDDNDDQANRADNWLVAAQC